MLAKGPEDPLVPQVGVLFNDVFTDIDDFDQFIAGYERWLRVVREKVDPDRLVERKPGEGWEPICRALGLPVPNRPFLTRTAPRRTWCARTNDLARTRRESHPCPRRATSLAAEGGTRAGT